MMSLPDPSHAFAVPPQQKRTARKLEAALNLTEEMLGSRTFAELSVNEIARKAGMSVGSFYYRFPDKKALLHELHVRYIQQTLLQVGQIRSAFFPGKLGFPRLASVFVMASVHLNLTHRGLLRTLLNESMTDTAFAERSSGMLRTVATMLAGCVDSAGRPSVLLIDEIETAMKRVKAVLDYDLIFGPELASDGTTSVFRTMEETERLRRIFLASLNRETHEDLRRKGRAGTLRR